MALETAGIEVHEVNGDARDFFERDCREEVAQRFDHARMSALAATRVACGMIGLRRWNRL